MRDGSRLILLVFRHVIVLATFVYKDPFFIKSPLHICANLYYCILTVILEIGRYESNFVLFKIVWSSLVSLPFNVSFRINLSSTKKILLDFDFDFAQSVDQFWEN